MYQWWTIIELWKMIYMNFILYLKSYIIGQLALVTNLQSTDTKKVDKYQYDTTMWSTTDKSLIDTLQTYRN